MKGIVAEINGKYAVVLTQTGSFKRVKASPDMEIGKEIDLNSPDGRIAKSIAKVTSLAAAGLLAIGVGVGAYSYTLPYTYVHVDINPSIELTVNIYDRIIGAEALNEDGEALLSSNNLKNEKVDAGVTQLLNTAVQLGYLNNTPAPSGNVPAQSVPDEPDTAADKPETTPGGSGEDEPTAPQIANAVLVTVSSNNAKKSVILEKELSNAVSVELDKDRVKSEILIAKTSVEQRNDARKFGVTPGKLVLIEDAMEGKSEAELEKLKKAAIRDLLVMAANKKIDKEKQAAGRMEKSEKQKAEEAAKKKEEAGRKPAEEAAKKKEETGKKAAEAAKKKEEAEKKAEEAAKKKAEKKKEEEKAKAQRENNLPNPGETKKNNNSLNQNKKNDQSGPGKQGDKGKKTDIKNQENRPNTGKITGQDLKKERERLKDEILNQMNNNKKGQNEKHKEQDNQRRNNK